MHAILSYRGNRLTNTATNPHTNRQDWLQYTAPQLACSVIISVAVVASAAAAPTLYPLPFIERLFCIITAIFRWTWVRRYHNISILDFIAAKDDGGGSDNWSYKTCKAQVKTSPPTNQHPVFLQAGCPSCRPTNSVRALKGDYYIIIIINVHGSY